MEGQIHLNPKLVVERLQKAMNDRDLDAFVDCFDSLYYAEQPSHPDRAFRGREKIRMEWSTIFGRILDFRSEIVHCASVGDVVWTEWHWRGTQTDNSRLDMRGVTILGVRENRFIWGRLFMEPVQVGGAGIDAAVDQLYIAPQTRQRAV